MNKSILLAIVISFVGSSSSSSYAYGYDTSGYDYTQRYVTIKPSESCQKKGMIYVKMKKPKCHLGTDGGSACHKVIGKVCRKR